MTARAHTAQSTKRAPFNRRPLSSPTPAAAQLTEIQRGWCRALHGALAFVGMSLKPLHFSADGNATIFVHLTNPLTRDRDRDLVTLTYKQERWTPDNPNAAREVIFEVVHLHHAEIGAKVALIINKVPEQARPQ